MSQQPFYLCGTTASGKTSLALALARETGGEIVNGDAFQVYRGLEILSAAPTAEEQACCPHHLFGFRDLDEPMDAAKYAALAGEVIADILERGKRPIVVGGSGLYLKFLTHGIAEAPGGDPVIRAELDALPVEEVLRRLQELDPEEAARQNQQNHRHLSRALEICLITGGKASDLRRNFEDPKKITNLRGIALSWPREILSERITQRTAQMLADGAIEEVAGLPADAQTVRQAIGVKEIEAFLTGSMTRDECEERIAISTRQYAKRQRNWFRREEWLKSIDGSLATEARVRLCLEV
ncbi:MAG: tRNA (adenosine(37)-N6)-dimethylallyltransferase MiaA [Akkermansiaceae bacterium]|jgi:tRNA dimethylallyltransferase